MRTLTYTHRFPSADALWEMMRRGTVRMQPLVFGQPEETLARIRAAYDRNILSPPDDDGGVSMPISVKVAAGFREQSAT